MSGRDNKNYKILCDILGDDRQPVAEVTDEWVDADLRNDFILWGEGKHVNRDPSEFAKFMSQLKNGR